MAGSFLYHTGFQVIREPDISVGRKNADFGQGFYLSDNEEFSLRWARTRRGSETYLNIYRVDYSGLNIKRFSRDEEWFEYIFANRAGRPDLLAEYDVIVGPIANDTIYDTWGIITSGLITTRQALSVLTKGPLYEQTVVKTQKALSQLSFDSSRVLPAEEIGKYRDAVREEEAAYQQMIASRLGDLSELLG